MEQNVLHRIAQIIIPVVVPQFYALKWLQLTVCGDASNFQKALEDDVAKRVLHEIFDDNSFVMNTSTRCARPKLT